MTQSKRPLFTGALNALTAIALAVFLSAAFMTTTQAASFDEAQWNSDIAEIAKGLNPTPIEKSEQEVERACYQGKLNKPIDPKGCATARAHRAKILKTLREQQSENSNDPVVLREQIKSLKAKNSALFRKNKALKAQASQSCSVATQPENDVKKSTGLGYVPVVGELSGPPGQDPSIVGEAAK